ncbi:hypothetical protein DF947_04325 [Pedobacter paludis]|uniref:Uncharacterized protein n=1 Tax=Pedobacter paludis TaxID=2203212 RepID=A0A317F3T9_9SPHI|nr:hypothetical protein DF947_04325 [Pedobacter paludis]
MPKLSVFDGEIDIANSNRVWWLLINDDFGFLLDDCYIVVLLPLENSPNSKVQLSQANKR